TAAPGPVVLLTFAGFKNDVLIECDEILVRELKPDASATAAADALWNAMEKMREKEKDTTVTRLARTCGEQFRDRKPFGVCHDIAFGKNAKGIRANIYHFAFAAVFKSDWAMRECLESGGDWKAMSKDSPEF